MKRFLAYDWPGNVRELQNVILRYLATGQAQFISPAREGAPSFPQEREREREREFRPATGETLDLALARAERDIILRALESCGGNKLRAAERLGVNLRTFHRRCAKLGIVRRLQA